MFMLSITDLETRAEVMSVYVESIKTVWWVSMSFALLAFVLVIVQKEIPLRKELDTEFGIQEKGNAEKTDAELGAEEQTESEKAKPEQ
jgi:uncharacterized Zn finger protein